MNDKNNNLTEDRLKVYELCKTHLGGEWAQVKEDDLLIERITDGNVNKLYICGLPEINNNCDKVVIRFDTQGFEEFKSTTHVLAMNVILSAKNIAPTLVCAFNGGTISEYIENRYFNYVDDQDSIRVGLLASKLAQLHAMNMPIPKKVSDFFKADNPMMSALFKNYKEKVLPQLQQPKFECLSKFKFIEEHQWLLKVVDSLESPLVFSHNDFNKKNILVNDSKGLQIFVIDFDWSSYNKRGYDLGQYFSSWGQIDPDFGFGDFPTDEQMSVFIESYIKEMSKIVGDSYAKQEINSKERLIKEAKVFALMAYMKDFFYFNHIFDQDNTVMDKAEIRMRCYAPLKKRILQDYNL